jgi:hypothetical protein
MSQRLIWIGVLFIGLLALLGWPSSVGAAVTVQRADVDAGQLQVEGTAAPDRNITVDGVVLGRSATDGRFLIERNDFTPPPACTIDVNDGSTVPAVATLIGCVVTSPATVQRPPAGTLLR